jgi:hypothetical protein
MSTLQFIPLYHPPFRDWVNAQLGKHLTACIPCESERVVLSCLLSMAPGNMRLFPSHHSSNPQPSPAYAVPSTYVAIWVDLPNPDTFALSCDSPKEPFCARYLHAVSRSVAREMVGYGCHIYRNPRPLRRLIQFRAFYFFSHLPPPSSTAPTYDVKTRPFCSNDDRVLRG